MVSYNTGDNIISHQFCKEDYEPIRGKLGSGLITNWLKLIIIMIKGDSFEVIKYKGTNKTYKRKSL